MGTKRGAEMSKKVCSKNCQYYKRGYVPWEHTDCLFDRNGYHKDTKDGRYCKNFKERAKQMFRLRKKEEIVDKYFELLRKDEKSEKDKIEINLMDWLFEKDKRQHNK